jgi:hypothetical protein
MAMKPAQRRRIRLFSLIDDVLLVGWIGMDDVPQSEPPKKTFPMSLLVLVANERGDKIKITALRR